MIFYYNFIYIVFILDYPFHVNENIFEKPKETSMRYFKWSVIVILELYLSIFLLAQDHGFSDERATKHYSRDRTYDIQHLKLEVSFDQPQKMVFGTATYTITPINDGLRVIELDEIDLTFKSVTLNNKALNYSSEDGKLRIDLDRAYDESEFFDIVINYQAQPKMGLYFIQPEEGYPDKPWQIWSQGEMEENRFWYPCYDFPNDRMTSEMIVTVPNGQIVISNGELVEVIENKVDNTKTYHWQENIPHVNYLNSLIVGNFVEIQDEWDGIPVNYYVEPQDSAKAKRSFAKTPDMVRFFSEKIGIRYPYEKYTQTTVSGFMWGGMENISATTLTNNTLHDQRADLDNTSDGLVAHELAHQWWGDLLTCKNWNHIWLNEGFATYFDALYVEHNLGKDEYLMEMEGNRKIYLREDSIEYRRPIVYNYYEDPYQMFDRHTYQKGAWVLQMIRYVLGDELWWKAIHYYGERFEGYIVETNDFRQAIEDATGKSVEWLFDEWLYRGGYPEYLVNWEWNADSNSVLLNVKQIQAINEVTPLFRMPIEIEISGEFGEKFYVINVDQQEETFEFQIPSKPQRVEFDPREQILKKLKFIKTKEELLNQLLYSNYTAGKIRAARWLGKFVDDKDVIKALSNVVSREKFWGVREQAAETLGKSEKREARDALIMALRDKKSDVRRKAIKSLSRFENDKRVEKALLNVFEKDSSYYAQAEAVRSLAKMNYDKASAICVQALFKDSYNEVIRKAAFDGFIQLKNPHGIDHAFVWAAYGKPIRARVEAIRALGKLEKYDENRSKEIYDRLVEYLQEDNFMVRNESVKALADIGNPDTIALLEDVEAHEYHFRWKQIVRKAIKKLKNELAAHQTSDSP